MRTAGTSLWWRGIGAPLCLRHLPPRSGGRKELEDWVEMGATGPRLRRTDSGLGEGLF